MKIQTLYKRLSMPVLFTVICVTGIGVSTPARSATLAGSQSTAINAKPEATLIAGNPCPYGMKPEFDYPCHSAATNKAPVNEVPVIKQFPSEDSSKDPRYQHPRQQQRELEIQRQQQQRELEIQQRELKIQPTVEPSPQNQQQ